MNIMLAIALVVGIVGWLALCAWDERDLIRDAFKAIYGGSSGGANDIAAEMNQMRTRIGNIGRIAFPGYERFEAWTQCPSCDRVAVHAMRQPKVMVGQNDSIETTYDTIRTCECGQEWGQR